jgi:hypothetical protein
MSSFNQRYSRFMRTLGIETVSLVILAGGTAAACGSDAKPCEETQTCLSSPSGGEGGDDAQGGSSNGGKGGTSAEGGTGGAAGTAGAAGAGGTDDEAPTVVSFTPADSDADVERDIEVTAELSEPIDEATVTNASVTLEGPDGEVPGILSVDENVIAFVPDEPLNLLGTYTFTLADTIADLAGNTLADSASAEFQVRDGRWGTPAHPFGQTTTRAIFGFQRNSLGDAVVGMVLSPSLDTIQGAVYAAEEDRWSPVEVLRSSTSMQYVRGAGIDASRRAVVTWSGDSTHGWSRFTDAEGWNEAGALTGVANVAVTSTGEATALWFNSTNYVTRTQDLSDGTLDAEIPFGPFTPDSNVLLVASLDRMAAVGVRTVTNGKELVVSWKGTPSWGPAESLASASEIVAFAVDGDEQGNIVVVWRDVSNVRARIYDRADDNWTQEELVAPAAANATFVRPCMSNGNAIVAFVSIEGVQPTVTAAVYQAGVGWLEDSVVTLDGGTVDGNIAVAIDGAGNALATWSTELRYRRYVAGEAWLATESLLDLDLNLDLYRMWSTIAPDGSVLVVSNDLGGSASPLPWAIRFE